jgi:hypothetical protein
VKLPPIILSDIILLLVVNAIILLITAELTNPHHGLTNLIIKYRKVRKASLCVALTPLLLLLALQISKLIT